ncbi:hypothetical protein CMI41_02415 [Candidatus Pacearchaeota archaeon]|nr:hypothetical protein [Candidatus Pacearchaeota archaeon]
MKPEPTWKFMDRHFNEVPDTHAEVVSITVYNEEGNPANHTLWIDKNLDLSSPKEVEKSIDFFQKSKVYVKSPGGVPPGYTLQRGPKGGLYYDADESLSPGWVDDDIPGGVSPKQWRAHKAKLLLVTDLQDIRDALLPEPLIATNGEEYSYDGTLDGEFERAAEDKLEGKPGRYHHMHNIGERLIDKGVTGDKAVQWWTMHMEGWAISPSKESGVIMKTIAKHFITPEGEVKEFVEGKNYVAPRQKFFWSSSKITREDYDGFMAQYEYTQEELHLRMLDNPLWHQDSVRLFRGIGFESFKKWEELGRPADMPFKSDSLSSWTSNKLQAELFAEQYGPDNKGLVLEAWVPRKKIFASYRTNHKLLHFHNEQEYIVLGSEKDKANVTTYWEDGSHKIRDLRRVPKKDLENTGWSKHKIDELFSGERLKKPWERVAASISHTGNVARGAGGGIVITEVEWPPGSGNIIGIEELSDKEFDEWLFWSTLSKEYTSPNLEEK